MKQHRFRHILFGSVLALVLTGFFMKPGNSGVKTESPHCIRTYGGKLSAKTLRILESMNKDLGQVKRIMRADSNRLVFMSNDANKKQVRYSYGSLWLDDSPCLPNVHAFHFEYRDKYGNLLTRYNGHLQSVETVAYVIRFGKNRNHVTTSYETRIRSGERLTSAIENATLAQVHSKTL